MLCSLGLPIPVSDALTFDPEKHEYSVNGKILPSVTEVIRSAGLVDFSKVPPETLRMAQERGTAVHAACHLYDAGTLDYASLDAVIWPYLEAWDKFVRQADVVIDMAEHAVWSKHGYAGTFDRLATMAGKPVILDIKTSEIISQATGVQLSAYLKAAEETGCIGMVAKKYQRFAVHLYDNGKYELEPYTSEQDWSVFLACLQIHHFKRRAT